MTVGNKNVFVEVTMYSFAGSFGCFALLPGVSLLSQGKT